MASAPLLREALSEGEPVWQAVSLCERVAALLLLIVVTPLLAMSALAVAVASGRSPFIAHRRVGWRGNPLWMLKLRTMWTGPAPEVRNRWIEYIEDPAGPPRKHARDPRVGSWFARFCRQHSIDEIPQLWHVIRGEMALIGPRPLTPGEICHQYGTAARQILRVRPGIAGLWQVSGRNRLSYAERRAMDLEYVRYRSLRMYLRILWRTIPEVIHGRNSY